MADEPTFVLDAITVLGTGLETPLLESPASVTVIDQETIAESPPSSVAELLRDVPGVEISSAGVPGVERIRIRGEESRRVIIQIDGQPLTDESGFGQPILVDPTTVERIEVVRGASSVVSGSRAIGGVVNIITKRGGKRPVEGSATGSYFSATSGYRAAASVAGATGGFDYRLSAGRSEQGDQRTPDGRLEPSDFDDSSLSGHLGYAWGNHYLSMKAQQYKLAANGYTGDPNFTLELPARDLRKIGLFYEGSGFASWLTNIKADVYYQTIDREFRNRLSFAIPLPPPRPPATQNLISESEDTQATLGGALAAELALFDRQRTLLGLEYSNEFLDSESSSTTSFPAPNQTVRLDEARIQTVSGFGQHEIALTETLKGFVGARVYAVDAELEKSNNAAPNSNDDVRALGSLGLVYVPSDAWSLRANLSQGYTYPTLAQLFLSTTAGGQLTVGNPDLDPETSVTFEIGGRYGANGVVLDAAIFYSRAKDFIDRQQTSTPPAPPAGSYFNLDRATTYGFEIFAKTQIGKTGWSPYLSASVLRREFDYGNGTTTFDSGTPLLSGRAGVRYDWLWGDTAFGHVDVFVRGQSGARERSRTGALAEGDGFATLNLHTRATIQDNLRIGVALNNLLDQSYAPLDETPAAGRNLELFATINF